MEKRTPAKKKAKELSKYLKKEHPDYIYMKEVFRQLRDILEITVTTTPKKLPYVPTDKEIQAYYKAVWQTRNMQHMVIIKTLLYTGVRVTELVNIEITNVDLESCQIRIEKGKGKKDRIVPFPKPFKEVLAMHIDTMEKKNATNLFESSWKRKYTDRGIRKILTIYARIAGIKHSIYPHRLRHFLFTWLKKQGIDDALIQPYSGHSSRQSLEVYSKLSLADAQKEYDEAISKFPI